MTERKAQGYQALGLELVTLEVPLKAAGDDGLRDQPSAGLLALT